MRGSDPVSVILLLCCSSGLDIVWADRLVAPCQQQLLLPERHKIYFKCAINKKYSDNSKIISLLLSLFLCVYIFNLSKILKDHVTEDWSNGC